MEQTSSPKPVAFLRDGFLPFEHANISIASSPVLYGLSAYTVFGASWNEQKQQLYLFRLKDHWQRLVNSSKILDFDSFARDWPYEKFAEVMTELVKQNNIQEDVLLRVSVFVDEILAGTKMHGLRNSLSAFVYPLGEILNRQGIHVCVSSWQRTADNAIPSRAKANGSYINASLMKNEALLNGYDEAIALDSHGQVSEGTVANIFLVRSGKLITPDPATDILEGVTRNSIFALADNLGIKHEQRPLDRSELYTADEAFMCGSSALVTPILSIDKRPLGHGIIGPVTTELMEEYDQLKHGQLSGYDDWLTSVQ